MKTRRLVERLTHRLIMKQAHYSVNLPSLCLRFAIQKMNAEYMSCPFRVSVLMYCFVLYARNLEMKKQDCHATVLVRCQAHNPKHPKLITLSVTAFAQGPRTSIFRCSLHLGIGTIISTSRHLALPVQTIKSRSKPSSTSRLTPQSRRRYPHP